MPEVREAQPGLTAWLFWLLVGYAGDVMTFIFGARWGCAEARIFFAGKLYMVILELALSACTVDWALRPFFRMYRRLARSPLYRDWFTAVEDDRVFVMKLGWRGLAAKPVDDEYFNGDHPSPQ